jgi:hypothetical protein
MADLEFVTALRTARAGVRNNLEVIKDVKSKERKRNLVGSLAIDETSSGG